MRSPLSLLQLLPVPPALGLHGAVAVDKQESCAVRAVRGSCSCQADVGPMACV